jgi:D-tyrosyl-tRNA(Tyr) deacylase
MRAVVQRVSQASVSVAGRKVASIESGLLILLGIHRKDSDRQAVWMAGKLARLRIFEDEDGVMNRSLLDSGGDALVISQFTLLANNRKGNRPSFNDAARPEEAIPLYERCAQELETLLERPVPTGVFGAEMKVALTNEGPVTLVVESVGGGLEA